MASTTASTTRWLALLVAATLVAACGGSPAASELPPAASATPTASPAPTWSSPTASAAPVTTPPPDAGSPAVWFAPMPYAPEDRPELTHGARDYDALFTAGSPWPVASEAVSVFKVYSGWVEWYATDDQIRGLVASTAARGQQIAIEIGPLAPAGGCGLDVEGFNASLAPIRRIQAAGGRVAWVAFDEPYAFGSLYDGERACGWSMERVATETAAFVRSLREAEPGVLVGDIEPQWASLTAARLGEWLDAYRAAAGSPFDFVHLDVDWNRADWPDWVAASAAEIRSRGLPLGVIYNGGTETSDEAWTSAARVNASRLEQRLGGPPEQVIVQSWLPLPTRVLPETDPTTLTGLLRQYVAAERTVVAARVSALPDHAGATVTGTLATSGGAPVAGARVGGTVVGLDGGYEELALVADVPAGATTALVGLRVNAEGTGSRAVRVALYEVTCEEEGGSGNLVPDPRFVEGAPAWIVDGTADARFVPSDLGAGRMLVVTSGIDESLVMNGGEFPVTPGRRVRLAARVAVPEQSAANPVLDLIFLAGTEVGRERLRLEPAAHDLEPVVTDASGTFRLELPPAAGRRRLTLVFEGDLDRWPSWVEMAIPGP